MNTPFRGIFVGLRECFNLPFIFFDTNLDITSSLGVQAETKITEVNFQQVTQPESFNVITS